MYYGLNKFIKNLLPRRLFYRALLIVATPIIILQLIITIVFFDSLWIKTNKGMTRALIGEIKTFIAAYDYGNYDNNDLSGLFAVYLDLNVEYQKDNLFTKHTDERWYSPVDRSLRRELKSNFGSGNYWFSTLTYKDLIHLNIKHGEGYFKR
jgi:two-component system osmolarity sensor histidine kinase EnvZ